MRLLIGIVLIGMCITGFGQKDEKASALLEEVSNKTKAYKSIKADFTYTMDNKAAKIHETKTGTLLVSGDKYKLNAVGQTIFCDGKTVWTYIKESNEVQINDMDTRDEAITPSRLLTSYNANYLSKIIQDKDATDPNLAAIQLTPITAKNFVKAILIVDKKLKQVKAFKIFDKNGNIFTYNVTKFQPDVPISASDFTFVESSYPGVEVIDMR
ncbi:MAG: outer membrane lipoprotein carrier protein LolA [bacterium]